MLPQSVSVIGHKLFPDLPCDLVTSQVGASTQMDRSAYWTPQPTRALSIGLSPAAGFGLPRLSAYKEAQPIPGSAYRDPHPIGLLSLPGLGLPGGSAYLAPQPTGLGLPGHNLPDSQPTRPIKSGLGLPGLSLTDSYLAAGKNHCT